MSLQHSTQHLLRLESIPQINVKFTHGPFWLDQEKLLEFAFERGDVGELWGEDGVEWLDDVVGLTEVGGVVHSWYQNTVPDKLREITSKAFKQHFATFFLLTQRF